MSVVVGVGVTDAILKSILRSNISIDLNWDGSWAIGGNWSRSIGLGPGKGNSDKG